MSGEQVQVMDEGWIRVRGSEELHLVNVQQQGDEGGAPTPGVAM